MRGTVEVTSGSIVVAGAIAVLSLGCVDLAAAQVRGLVTGPAQTSFTVAIPPLHGVDPAIGQRFSAALARNLSLSGFFRVMPKDVASSVPLGGVTQEEIDFASWSRLGSRVLIAGRQRQSETGRLVLEARIFDVAERRQIGGKRYEGGSGDVPSMANRFADEVLLRLTGKEGPFHSRIAFVSTRAGRFKELFVVNFDGSGLKQLTGNNTINLTPAWAPDGETIFFTSYRDGRPKIYEADPDTRLIRKVVAGRGLTIGGRVSPDGRQVAVAREETKGNSEIVVFDRRGRVLRRITEDASIDVSPSWSPDGRRLAFCSARSGRPQVYVVDLATGQSRTVTAGRYDTQPVWSPTDDRIAYTGRVDGRFQIFVVDLPAGSLVQVTSSRGDNDDPAWSPDGRYLLFRSTRNGSSKIFMSDWRGRQQRQLIAGAGNDSSPSWSPRLARTGR